jgi:hypothetical protein
MICGPGDFWERNWGPLSEHPHFDPQLYLVQIFLCSNQNIPPVNGNKGIDYFLSISFSTATGSALIAFQSIHFNATHVIRHVELRYDHNEC